MDSTCNMESSGDLNSGTDSARRVGLLRVLHTAKPQGSRTVFAGRLESSRSLIEGISVAGPTWRSVTVPMGNWRLQITRRDFHARMQAGFAVDRDPDVPERDRAVFSRHVTLYAEGNEQRYFARPCVAIGSATAFSSQRMRPSACRFREVRVLRNEGNYRIRKPLTKSPLGFPLSQYDEST